MSSTSTQSPHAFHSFWGQLLQVSLGLSFMLMGGLLVITFWLLPIGVLLVLLGLAIMCAGGSPSKPSFHSVAQADAKPCFASADSVRRILNYLMRFESKTGTSLNPDRAVRDRVMLGLAKNYDRSGRPLCPCVHHPEQEIDSNNHELCICPCDEMRDCKFCHCLMFVSPNGLPITQYLPENHEGRQIYGLVEDPEA